MVMVVIVMMSVRGGAVGGFGSRLRVWFAVALVMRRFQTCELRCHGVNRGRVRGCAGFYSAFWRVLMLGVLGVRFGRLIVLAILSIVIGAALRVLAVSCMCMVMVHPAVLHVIAMVVAAIPVPMRPAIRVMCVGVGC